MEENKNPQAETLSEEQLNEVAGGNDTNEGDCYFEPENPPIPKNENGMVWVKCKSRCNGALWVKWCQCHKTERCINKWHIVEQANPGVADGNWYATPKGQFNHNEGRKLIKNLFI